MVSLPTVPSLLSSKVSRLCDVRFTTVKANINLNDVTVNSKTGDFNPTSLAQVINTDTINHLVVQTWLDRAGALLTSPQLNIHTYISQLPKENQPSCFASM